MAGAPIYFKDLELEFDIALVDVARFLNKVRRRRDGDGILDPQDGACEDRSVA